MDDAGGEEEEDWTHKGAPMLFAAAAGDVAELKKQIAAGADVNRVTRKKGEAPLHVAAKRGHLEAVKLLLEAGADVNLRRRNEDTPLLIAAHRGQVDVINELLDNGADLSLVGRGLRSHALHIAVENEDEAVARAVLKDLDEEAKEALFRQPNLMAHTALDLAEFTQKTGMIELLKSFGAVSRPLNLDDDDDEEDGGSDGEEEED